MIADGFRWIQDRRILPQFVRKDKGCLVISVNFSSLGRLVLVVVGLFRFDRGVGLRSIVSFLLVALLVVGTESVGRDTVFVSISPQAYFVERILGLEGASPGAVSKSPKSAVPQIGEGSGGVDKSNIFSPICVSPSLGGEVFACTPDRFERISPAIRNADSLATTPHPTYPVSHWNVQVLVKPGHSPETYEPTPKQLAALAEAKLYSAIGVPFETIWLGKIRTAAPNLKIVGAAFPSAGPRVDNRENRPEPAQPLPDRHSHKDLHVWLDPILVKSRAEIIAQAFMEIDPDNAAAYRANLVAFQADLDDIHNQIKEILKGLEGRTMLVFHPAWGYFAARYGLRQLAIEVEGKEPGARSLAEFVQQAERLIAQGETGRVIFVQQGLSTRSAQAVAQVIGARLVTLDPLARDYLANLYRTAVAIRRGLLTR